MMATPVALETVELTKEYPLEGGNICVIRGVNISIRQGEFVAILGSSGSGKSTLLSIFACLERPSSGQYMLGGDDVSKLGDDDLSEIRSRRLGIIFQSYNLIAHLNVIENIEVPLFYQGVSASEARARALSLASFVGLATQVKQRPFQLSGGQQQRVAIARSLANDPLVILADEPTGNLDSAAEGEILGFLTRLHQDGKTIVMVTHDEGVARVTDRVIQLHDGKVLSDRVQRKQWGPPSSRRLKAGLKYMPSAEFPGREAL